MRRASDLSSWYRSVMAAAVIIRSVVRGGVSRKSFVTARWPKDSSPLAPLTGVVNRGGSNQRAALNPLLQNCAGWPASWPVWLLESGRPTRRTRRQAACAIAARVNRPTCSAPTSDAVNCWSIRSTSTTATRTTKYKPEELGYVGAKDFRGRYRAHEGLIYLGYGLSDRVALELEIAAISATLVEVSGRSVRCSGAAHRIGPWRHLRESPLAVEQGDRQTARVLQFLRDRISAAARPRAHRDPKLGVRVRHRSRPRLHLGHADRSRNAPP